MASQRFVVREGLWECAGCHVRFSQNEDGQTFLIHHPNCPEVAAMREDLSWKDVYRND